MKLNNSNLIVINKVQKMGKDNKFSGFYRFSGKFLKYYLVAHWFGLAGLGGGVSGASSTDSDECDARTPLASVPGSPINSDNSFGVSGISAIVCNKDKIKYFTRFLTQHTLYILTYHFIFRVLFYTQQIECEISEL